MKHFLEVVSHVIMLIAELLVIGYTSHELGLW